MESKIEGRDSLLLYITIKKWWNLGEDKQILKFHESYDEIFEFWGKLRIK